MIADARQKCGNLRFANMCNVIWANQKTESFDYLVTHITMFDLMSFLAILSGIDVISDSVNALLNMLVDHLFLNIHTHFTIKRISEPILRQKHLHVLRHKTLFRG